MERGRINHKKLYTVIQAQEEALHDKLRSDEIKNKSAFCRLPTTDLKTAKLFVYSLKNDQIEDILYGKFSKMGNTFIIVQYSRGVKTIHSQYLLRRLIVEIEGCA